jgi:hypothetical protein
MKVSIEPPTIATFTLVRATLAHSVEGNGAEWTSEPVWMLKGREKPVVPARN